jgi:predicted transcriptional regulator
MSLGSYRGRLDVIADNLQVVSQNAKKIQIMYQANLAEIIEASLINFQDEKQYYMLTTKEREFLDAYQKYSEINRHVKKPLNDVRAPAGGS